MNIHPRNLPPIWAYLLASLGILVILTEIVLNFLPVFVPGFPKYELNHGVEGLAILLSFAGFYGINPKGTERGAKILTDNVVAIISLLPFAKGKRAEVAITPVEKGVPTDEHTVIVPVEKEP